MSRRRRTAYVSIMLVGAVALAVDRCMLSAPALQPDAAVALEPEQDPAQSSSESSRPRVMVVPKLAFPRNLNSYRVSSIERDLFTPIGDALGPSKDGAQTDKPQSADDNETEDRQKGETFARRHRLVGIMLYDGLKIAIVDGSWVRVGESVDGCELERISGFEAQFRCDDEHAVLRMADKHTFPSD